MATNPISRSWYTHFKSRIKNGLSPTSWPYRALNQISAVVESKDKMFALSESLSSFKYGQTYVDRSQYLAFQRLSRFLDGREVDLVDIGARWGWFTCLSPRFFQVRKRFAYEPLSDCNAHLQPLTKRFPDLQIRNVLLGSQQGERKFYHYRDGGSSSVNKYHREFQDRNELIGEPILRETTLTADLTELNYDGGRPLLLKIDTQGAELDVLEGAKDLFEKGRVLAVIVEVQTQPIYENKSLWIPILEYFARFDLVLLDVIPGLRCPDETINELDAIFVKRSKASG